MAQQLDTSIQITYIQSPINQISPQLLQEIVTKQQDKVKQPGNDSFQDISKRLENNLKKISSIEDRQAHSNKQFNFKSLKNALLNGHENRGAMAHEPATQHQKHRPYQKYNTPNNQRGSSSSRRYSRQKNFQYLKSASGKVRLSDKKPATIESCLKELKDIKKTIKDLKETCKSGFKTDRKVSSILEERSVRSRHKYTPGSVTKYSYSNYKDLSHGRHNHSQERQHYSDKKFSWLRNAKTQQFSIDASGDK